MKHEAFKELIGIPFSDEQLAAITAPLAPGVIIAGAGTGKTTVMAARVVWLVATGQVAPDGVLGISFTRKASGELRHRVIQDLKKYGIHGDTGYPTISTYDSFATRLVQEFGLLLGLDGEAKLLNDLSAGLLARQVVAETSLSLAEFHRQEIRFDRIVAGIVQFDSELQSHLISIDEARDGAIQHQRRVEEIVGSSTTKAAMKYLDAALARRVWLDLVAEYQQRKRDLGVRQFSDYTALAAQLSAEFPLVGRTLRDRYPVVLVDEYQDTSMAQVELLQNLFSGPDAQSGRGHALTAVGDPYQSIYTWRGAAASNISFFNQNFCQADGTESGRYSLTVNRRSDIPILQVANAVATTLKEVGHEGVSLVGVPGESKASISVEFLDDWLAELDWLVADLATLKDRGEITNWRDVAILTRTNSWGTDAFERLREAGIPAQILGLSGLLHVPEVADVHAYLRLLANPADNKATIRLLLGPRWAIGKSDLAVLGQLAKVVNRDPRRDDEPEDRLAAAIKDATEGSESVLASSLLEVCATSHPGFSPAAADRLPAFYREMRALGRFCSEPLRDLCQRIISTTGLDAELQIQFPDIWSLQLDAFLAEVDAYVAAEDRPSLTGLVAYLDLAMNDDGLGRITEPDIDAVQIMTCHRAKGLEWPAVYIPHLGDGQFPSSRLHNSDNWVACGHTLPGFQRKDRLAFPQLQAKTIRELDVFGKEIKAYSGKEYQRLAYVSVTRAKRILRMSGHRRSPSGNQIKPSPYLVSAENHLAEFEERFSRVEQWCLKTIAAPTPEEEFVKTYLWPQAPEIGRVRRTAQDLFDHPTEMSFSAEEASTAIAWNQAVSAVITEEAERNRRLVEVALPPYLSATGVLRLEQDPDQFAQEILRPMPKPVSDSARLGTRFHAWLQQRFESGLAVDEEVVYDGSDPEFDRLCAAFVAGQFANQQPVAVEKSFTLVWEGVAIRGQIDAVFEVAPGQFLVVDWKTGNAHRADPGQLDIYRAAWAQLAKVAESSVQAAFYDVLGDKLLYHTSAGLSHLLDALTNPNRLS